MLLFGWSLVEGLGAVLVIPAIAALVAANYEGKDRAFAYGIIGGVAGAAIAVGPVIGGFVTTYFSWRYVFVGEVVIVIAVLLFRNRMQQAPKPEHPPKLDGVGAALSAVGLALIVFGILKSSTWGWITPIDAPTIDGHEITPLGFSLVPFLIAGGIVFLWLFSGWEERRERLGQDTLLERALLTIASLRAGLATLMSQQLVLMGTFFVLPVYLQVVLGLDAFETGKRLLPMSMTMLIAALTGPKLSTRFAPREIVRIGLLAMVVAALVLVGTIDVTLNETGFKLSLALFGVGAGLLMSQLGNVIMSSAPPGKTNEAGGLQGTAQNLGASLGTALIGSVLLIGLLTGFNDRIAENPALSDSTKTQISAATEQGIEIVTTEQVHAAVLDAGATPAEADAITADYGDAQLEALKKAMLAVALLALLSIVFTRRLPNKPMTPPEPEHGRIGLITARTGTLARWTRSSSTASRRPTGRTPCVSSCRPGAGRRCGSRTESAPSTGCRFSVPEGEIFGLLGPNGAGKSTTVRILTTLTKADAGRATVAGHDVRSEAGAVRRAIGYVPQASGVDRDATGRENLVLQGRLQGMRGADLDLRASHLLETFGLAEKAHALVKTYSGGMKRRLDVAIGLVHRPHVLFLDEPTTGLDPEVRAAMWDELERLAAAESPDDPAHDPLPRGGRPACTPRRDRLPRPGRRGGYARRAQARAAGRRRHRRARRCRHRSRGRTRTRARGCPRSDAGRTHAPPSRRPGCAGGARDPRRARRGRCRRARGDSLPPVARRRLPPPHGTGLPGRRRGRRRERRLADPVPLRSRPAKPLTAADLDRADGRAADVLAAALQPALRPDHRCFRASGRPPTSTT